MRADFPYLKPANWGGTGDGTANKPPGWSITGDAPFAVDTQAIVDSELIADQGYIDGYAWAWYPPESINVCPTGQSVITRAFTAHLASAHKNKVKVSVYLQYPWMMANAGCTLTDGTLLDTYAQLLGSQIRAAGDAWLTVKGRPVVYLYDPDSWAADLPNVALLKSRLPTNTYYVGAGSTSPASSSLTSIGASGTVQYGPNGITLVGAGQHAYSEVITADQARWTSSAGRDLTTGGTTAFDRRALAGDTDGNAIPWAPSPTMVDAIREEKAAYVIGTQLHTKYAFDELSEGGAGCLAGSAQMGRYIRDSGLYGRLLARGATSLVPNTYTYPVDSHSAYLTLSGWTWTRDVPSVITGAFAADELRASAAATADFTHEYVTRYRVFGSKASGWGSLNFRVDGGSTTTVSLNNGGAEAPMQQLFDSGVIAEGTHLLEVDYASGGNVSFDYVEVTMNPRSVN